MENYIKTAIRYAEGKMSGSDFEIEQASEPELWPWLQSLLTEEMKTDPKHEFWNICHSRSALEANNFRVKATALAFGYGFFGNMHDIVSSLVKTVYPDIKIKTPPSYTKYDFMYQIGMDYVGGKEADIIVQDILDKLPSDLKRVKGSAKQRTSCAKLSLSQRGNRCGFRTLSGLHPTANLSSLSLKQKMVRRYATNFTMKQTTAKQ